MNITLDCVKHKVNIGKLSVNLFLLFLSFGVILVTPYIVSDASSAGYMTLMSIGVVGAFIFAINILFRSKSRVYSPTGSSVKHHAANFRITSSDIDSLAEAIDSYNVDHVCKLKSDNNNDVLVDIIYSEDGSFGAYQISRYVPHQFEVVRDWHIVGNNNKMKQLVELLKV